MSKAPAVVELHPLSHHDGVAATAGTSAPAPPSEAAQGQPGDTTAEAVIGPDLSVLRSSIIVASVTAVLVASSMTTGLLAIALPRMTEELAIPEYLVLWPASIYGLTSGCSLLLIGSIADVVGSRIVYLVGCLFLSLSVLASGLARTSTQIIVFRGFQGIAASCCLPTAVSILSESFPSGRRRNIGFTVLGIGQPLGYSLGLFLGGFFVDSVGWRYAWYLCSGTALAVFFVAIWALPPGRIREKLTWNRFFQQLDLVGTVTASACLGILSYVLAVVSEGSSKVKDGQNIALLCIAGALIPTFVFWMDLRVKRNKPALIPNALWRKTAFSTVCMMVFLTWAVVMTVEYYFSLFFQEVQDLSALQTSIRFLPNVVAGIILTITIGMVLHRYSAYWIVISVSLFSAISPMLLAITKPEWSYWYTPFWAMLLSALAADVLFVVSNLVITNAFPGSTQALAGAVFNTVTQFGTAVGLAIMAVISSNVTSRSDFPNKSSPLALLEGYRASFWACFGAMILSVGIGAFGLRGVGRVGLKIE